MSLSEDKISTNNDRMRLLLIVGVIAFISTIFTNVALSSWKDRATEGEAIKLEAPGYHAKGKSAYYHLPLIKYYPSHISSYNLIRILHAVESYIHLKYDERNINFEKPTTAGRYDNLRMKKSLMKALSMTREGSREYKQLFRLYRDSDKLSKELLDCKCGVVFGIEGIEEIKEINSKDMVVTIIGKWYVIGDEVDKKKLKEGHKIIGNTRIWLTINQGSPLRDSKGRILNMEGIFVTDSYEEPLDSAMYQHAIDYMSQRYIQQLML